MPFRHSFRRFCRRLELFAMPSRSLVRVLFASLGWAAFVVVFFGGSASAQRVDPLDWPNWRGPQQNRVSMEKDLIDNWDPEGGPGSNVLWKRTDLGGRTSPIVMRGKLYTIARHKPDTAVEQEKVVCVDAATGDTIWEHRFNVYLSDVPDTRIGWSAPVGDPETGRIYVQGVCGYFCCLDGETGEVIWDRSLHEEMGLISTYGGRTNVPVIFEDSVLISAVIVGWGDQPKWGGLARPAHRFMCFDKATGELRWLNGTGISPYDTTYSTPTIMPVDGQQQMVFCSGDGGVWSLQPRTGKANWHYELSRAGVSTSPLVGFDGRVYASSAEENPVSVAPNTQGAAIALDAAMSGDLEGKQVWQHLQVMAGKSSPIMVGDRVYFIDDRSKMHIFDAESGEPIAKGARILTLGTMQRSTPLYADGKIYVMTNTGQWHILRPTANGVERVHTLRLRPDASGGSPESEGSMAVSHGRIYLPTSQALFCLAKPNQTPTADPLPAMPRESPLQDTNEAQIQIIPYDTLLKPGEQQAYRVRLFNAKGQFLREVPSAEVKFSVDGIGMVSADGKYTAPTDAKHDNALVTCEVGSLKGSGRVRIAPPLPWTFDFDDSDQVPLPWIGGRVRWEVRKEGGEQYIAKKTVLPTPKDPKNKLGTRSFIWMGPIDLANYTIQGDVLLKKVQLTERIQNMSDVGLINSRYQFTIRAMKSGSGGTTDSGAPRGTTNTLRIDSWSSSVFRTYVEVPFAPEPDVWYTLKLRVEPQVNRAVVSGKIWRRGDPEPRDWTISMIDESPNLRGTPGIYGNTPDAEVYLDNVLVVPNEPAAPSN
jgi:outer membrane protein assembly factor BamB